MSYLDPPRLHFAGTFQAAPSTVNNDPQHYDTATFDPADRESSWNPRGDAVWRLLGCTVTEAVMADGSPAAGDDEVRGLAVADSDRAVSAKLVDLDPQQQLVSMIFGLEVRLVTADGATWLRGRFRPAPFADIWDRAKGGGGDIGAGAMYQSVLTDLEWGDGAAGSPFLTELREAAAGTGRLSIKFNVDGYNLDIRSPEFTRGRITGTIGPAGAGEPEHFVRGRQFMATVAPQSGFFTPAGKINFCVASVDEGRGKVIVDLGNALPATAPGGPMVNLGDLSVVCPLPPPPGQQQPRRLTVGKVRAATYTAANWLESRAGVVELPTDRSLTADELEDVSSNDLLILRTNEQGQPALGIAESPGGVYVRADQFVFRLDAGEEAGARLYATVRGRPYAGARVITVFDPSQLQGGGPAPDVATPVDAVEYPVRVVTDDEGLAALPIRAGDPGTPRGYLDGQVYGLRPVLEETIYSPAGPYPFNQWTFISLLVWDAFVAEDPPTWHGSMRAIFQQYFNLYPVMDRMLDLSSYGSVCDRADILRLAFGLGADDPNSMPVTRDLSTPKRTAILRWLTDVGPDGKPLEGEAPPVAAAAPVAAPAPAPP
ncbi:MAG: hypothetical protein ACRD12_15515, partial [Acidimicrobiales bacterium]